MVELLRVLRIADGGDCIYRHAAGAGDWGADGAGGYSDSRVCGDEG